MKIAYLILAHDNPQHLARLIHALREEWTEIFVHVDRNSALAEFQPLLSIPKANFIRNRVSICWGGFSLVQATINLVTAAASSEPPPDWYVLLSGADYPIRSNDTFRAFLAQSKHEHISLDLESGGDSQKILSRLETYHFEGALGHQKPRRVLLHQTNRFLSFYKRDYRAILGSMVPYGGSQWWVLSREALSYILNFIDSNRRFVDFYKHVLIPDEMFFQTILGNSAFAPRIARNLTFADWNQATSRHPAPLTVEHVRRFADPNFHLDDAEGVGPCFFARKFSASDCRLLDQIDEIRTNTCTS